MASAKKKRRSKGTPHDSSSLLSLARWAMQTDSSGMAIVHDGKLEICNNRFRTLAKPSGTWWRLGGPKERESTPAFRDLRDLVLTEGEPLLRLRADGTWIRRYVREGSDDVIEVRYELHRSARDGKPRITALVHDVTARAGTEKDLETVRDRLADNARMRALGELASGMAHDLNNTLGALSLRLELLAVDPNCRASQGDNIEAIRRICTDAAARVRRLQDFGRRRHDRPLEIVDVAAILREAVEVTRPEIERTAQLDGIPLAIHCHLRELPPARGDASDLRHVVVNLLLNARDAMPQGGNIDISAHAEGQRILIEVADEGVGIPDGCLERVFDPFFTTKGERGTGLGLAIAAAVMARHEGSIAARNRPEGGARFSLELPASPQPRLAPPKAKQGTPPLPLRRVLIVDDDREHLDATCRVLEQAGQQVTAEISGRAAIERIQKGEAFDIVLCDIGMPDLNGWDVARAISAASPTTPIFMVSGWANEIDERDPRRKIVAGVLAKPVSLETLYRILGEPSRERAVLLS